MTITGNQIDRVRAQGIAVGPATATEGCTTPLAVVISDNVITDVINRNTIDGLNNSNNYITVSGLDQAGSAGAVPGHYIPLTGVLVPLYDNLPNDSATDPLAPAHFIIIANNVLARTLQAGVLYSSYGYGDMFTRNGYLDPTMTEAMLATTAKGVLIEVGARYVSVLGNTINGQSSGVFFNGAGADYEQIKIAHNTISDFSVGGVTCAGGMSGGLSITIDDNTFDGDPFTTSANRGASGTWLANGNPTALLLQGASGVSATGNLIKRCCRATDVATFGNNAVFLRNILEATVGATGFSTSNAGIGNCPFAGPAWQYRIVDQGPESVTFQQTLNNCFPESTAMPSTGQYVRGHMVWNENPTIAGKIVGWLRITTGSAHVLGTDWLAVTSA